MSDEQSAAGAKHAASRRDFLKSTGLALYATALPPWLLELEATEAAAIDKNKLADIALSTTKGLGATYADVRINCYHHESVFTREKQVQQVARSQNFGCGVRVL